MKNGLARVLDELVAGKLSEGRRYEKLNMAGDLFAVRLNRVAGGDAAMRRGA